MLCLALGACGGGDPALDGPPPDVSNGACGSMLRFAGEYLDWDSGDANFCGIFGAEFAVQDSAARTDITPPNGRVELCIPDAAFVYVDITPPSTESQCSTPPQLKYLMSGIAVLAKPALTAGATWSGRAFVTGRQAVDATKAHVLVHVIGTPRAVSIGAAHGEAQARVNDMWSVGNVSNDVFFPDVDPSGGTTTLVAGTIVGAVPVPLVAGKLTSITVLGR